MPDVAARSEVWYVQWSTHIPVETLRTPRPMTEGEALETFRTLARTGDPSQGGKPYRQLKVWPVRGSSDLGGRCVVCGMLVRIHCRTLPQFAKCYG
jgi:hypothetical protein